MSDYVYANPTDVDHAWRPLTPPETAAVEYLIGYATRKLRRPANVPRLDVRIAAGELDRELVRDTIVAAVLRVTKNPDSTRSHTETIDDHTETWVRDTEVSAGLLHFTDDELADLAPRGGLPLGVIGVAPFGAGVCW